jgi:hypothetical protein
MEKITQCETSRLVILKSRRKKMDGPNDTRERLRGNPYMIFVSKYEGMRRVG